MKFRSRNSSGWLPSFEGVKGIFESGLDKIIGETKSPKIPQISQNQAPSYSSQSQHFQKETPYQPQYQSSSPMTQFKSQNQNQNFNQNFNQNYNQNFNQNFNQPSNQTSNQTQSQTPNQTQTQKQPSTPSRSFETPKNSEMEDEDDPYGFGNKKQKVDKKNTEKDEDETEDKTEG